LSVHVNSTVCPPRRQKSAQYIYTIINQTSADSLVHSQFNIKTLSTMFTPKHYNTDKIKIKNTKKYNTGLCCRQNPATTKFEFHTKFTVTTHRTNRLSD